MHAKGESKRAIADRLNVCPKTVRRVLKKLTKPKKGRPSKLDEYRAVIRFKALEEGWQVRQIFKYIRELGYPGGALVIS